MFVTKSLNMYKKFCVPLYKFFKTNILYFFVIAAIVLLVFAYFVFTKNTTEFDLFKNLGFTLVSGGVFAVIVKSEQFSEIFQNELRNIIYGEENLKNRKDLEPLWEKVTKALCNQKFKLISKKLHDSVKQFYLPINHEYYYKNHSVDIHIEFDEQNTDYLIVTEETKTNLISDDNNPIIYKFSTSIPYPTHESELTLYELLSFTVNNSPKILDKKQLSIEKRDGTLFVECNYEVEDKRSYIIIRKEKKRYNLKENSFRQHNANWLYDNFFMDLTYPNNLNIKFIETGVINKWELEQKDTTNFKRLKASYSGLIFKKQGFLLLLNKI
jgi:hypothetical protein